MASDARILVIDDSPTIRRVLDRALAEAGWSVTLAGSGEAGLDEARGVAPDLIVLDFVMPGMNGYQFIKALADDPSVPEVPVLLMVTRTDQVPDDAFDGLGVVGTVTKPFAPEDMVDRIANILASHGQRARQETAPVSLPPELTVNDGSAPDLIPTEPGVKLPPKEQLSGFDDDLAAAAALADLTRVLADALFARGIDDADTLSEAICGQVRDGLQGALLRELVRRELGMDILRRPVPALYGDLAAVPLPEVLQLLKFQGQTGLLEVALGRGRYEVSFHTGHVIAIRARNAQAGVRLGQYFVEMKAITEEELEKVAVRPGDNRPLGQRLLADGRITDEQLADALGRQANDLMFDLLRAREGVFGLRPGEEVLASTAGSPGFSVDELLFESLRRVDEATVFRKEVPSLDTEFARAADATEDGLTAEEIEVFRLLPPGETQPARALMKAVSVAEHQIEKILYRLVVLGRARRVDPTAD
jgi:CheY-like chemotaxis protein